MTTPLQHINDGIERVAAARAAEIAALWDRPLPDLWGPVIAAAARGDLPLVWVGMSAAGVAQRYGGRQPVYLATPYSREVVDDDGVWSAGLNHHLGSAAARAAMDLMERDITAISPIALASVMLTASSAVVHDRGRALWRHRIDPLDAEAWTSWCGPLLSACDAVVVPDIPGWDRSVGILQEVREALLRVKPVYLYAGGAW